MSTEQVQTTENQEQAAPQRSYNPFIAPVNEKPYAQMNVEVGQQQLASPIPEPSYQSNRVSGNEDAYNMLNNDFGAMGGGASKSGGSSAPFNPAMNEIPDKDKHMGAEHLAKLIIDGYATINQFGNKLLQFNERKLRKMQSEGEIDLSTPIPYSDGQTITAGQFIEEFNEQNKDTLSVSKEFKKEVMPPLVRVLEKRGAGITDEQLLIYLFGKDIAVKGVIITQMRNTMNDVLEVIKEQTLAAKGGDVAVGTPVEKPKNTPPPPPKYTPEPESIVPMDSDDFNFRMNETVVESAVQKHRVPESGKARLMAQKKRDKEIEEAMKRANNVTAPANKPSYEDALKSKQTGKRGRKTKDYVKQVDESQIAEAIILSETKNTDSEKIEGLD